MNIKIIRPPRAFEVGPPDDPVRLYDCAHIELAPDEQVTFKGPTGSEYDFCRKTWGYYATPSLNSRLGRHGLRPALVRGCDDKMYVMAVERDRIQEFELYLAQYGLRRICWLDEDAVLDRLERHLISGAEE